MIFRVSIAVVAALFAAPARSADPPLRGTYVEVCRAAANEFGSGGHGRVSISVQANLTLTVSIWDPVSDGTELGSFCDFSREPRRLVEAYVTPCYHCGFTLASEDVERLNRRYLGN